MRTDTVNMQAYSPAQHIERNALIIQAMMPGSEPLRLLPDIMDLD